MALGPPEVKSPNPAKPVVLLDEAGNQDSVDPADPQAVRRGEEEDVDENPEGREEESIADQPTAEKRFRAGWRR